ncbi:trypsin-like peptidase domain-containing protein [Candidatus Kaiserbacteria bacterium]|nr:trypsin-like peptidase domain-containing protein [Candidatus Kaiserbacteria bacterium]
MSSRVHSFVAYLVVSIAAIMVFIAISQAARSITAENTIVAPAQIASVSGPSIASSSSVATTSAFVSVATSSKKVESPSKATVLQNIDKKTKVPAPAPQSTPASVQKSPIFEITRIKDPYPAPPSSFDDVNVSTRGTLVNILCMAPHGASVQPISGSGVIIDPRGVILTNAHVAQYVLLSESPRIDLVCSIRIGSPATPRWKAEVLYIPPVWVTAHVGEINTSHPQGTGEHDYALLRITGSIDSSPALSSFPYLSFDTREVIGFLGDPVLGAAYPAEFVGGYSALNNLNVVSSVSTIDQLMTFDVNSVDMISIGGVIEAQSGSSGGAVVNAWNKLIGIITTTSEGVTTAERKLHAITMSYVDRDIKTQTGQYLDTYLQGDLAEKESTFNTEHGLDLIDQYIKMLER